MKQGNPNYGEQACHPELILVLLTGVVHVVLEVLADGLQGAAGSLARPQHIFNLAAVVLWGGYLVWRVARYRGALAAWGFRRGGFRKGLLFGVVFAAAAAIPLFLLGAKRGNLPLPVTFWLTLVLYPLWGLAQQFGLQVLITRNLRSLVKPEIHRAAVASMLFGLAHFPNYWLMGLTFCAGFGFSWIYERTRNLWAIGIVHGVLGALAYYLVLGEDPGAELLGFLSQ